MNKNIKRREERENNGFKRDSGGFGGFSKRKRVFLKKSTDIREKHKGKKKVVEIIKKNKNRERLGKNRILFSSHIFCNEKA